MQAGLALALLLWAFVAPGDCLAAGGSRPVKVEIELQATDFAIGESVEMTVRVLNTGSREVTIPDPASPGSGQPVYMLRGPGYPQGHDFTLTSGHSHGPPGEVSEEPVPPLAPAPVRMRTLAPGKSVTKGVRLQQLVHLHAAGEYILAARLRGKDVDVSSNTVSFRLHENRFLTAAVGVDATRPKLFPTVWLGEGSGQRRLGKTLVYERRTDLGEVEVQSSRALATVSAAATDPFAVWSNVDKGVILADWSGWRERDELLALFVGAAQPQRAPLPADATLVRPVLMLPSGQLQAFALEEGGGRLSRIHFAPEGSAPAGPSATAKRTLDGKAVSAACTLGQSADGNDTHIILVSAAEGGLRLTLVAGDERQPGQSLTAQGVAPLANSVPAVRRDDQGRYRASVVASTLAEPRKLAIVDAVFAADPKETAITVGTIDLTVDRAVAAATAYVPFANGDKGRDWVVLLESGEALTSIIPGRPSEIPVKPVLPLQLVKKPQATYLLVLDAEHGPTLQPLF